MNATTRASADELDVLYTNLLRLLSTTDESALNWRPEAADTNSIAVLAAHIVGACGRWLSNAAGNPRMGNRPAEFTTHATPAQASQLIQQAQADARQWFSEIDAVDLGTERPMLGEETTTTAAWCVQHALAHAHEHWGQILLTRQLADAAAQPGHPSTGSP